MDSMPGTATFPLENLIPFKPNMNIMCCYINNQLSVRALESFALHAPGVEMINCTGNWDDRETMKLSMTRYWHEIRKRWTGVKDLVVLRQAAPITPETILSFIDCSNMLCTKDGATRYSHKLQRLIPADIIGGDYMVWHLVNERMATLWDLHQIKICFHD